MEDQYKKTFATPWRTFQYLGIPFNLLINGSIFKNSMDLIFKDIMEKNIDLYHNDLAILF